MSRSFSRLPWSLLLLAALTSGCGDNDTTDDTNDAVTDASDASDDTATDDAQTDTAGDTTEVPDATQDTAPDTNDVAEDTTADVDAEVPDPSLTDCDPLQESVCSLPWPSNLYLQEDPERATGYTLAFGATTLPANNRGVHISPDDYRRLDGYSVGGPIMVHFPGLDMTGMPTEWNPGPSLEDDSPVLLWRVLEDGSLERIAHWVEADSHATDPARQLTFVRPAVILDEATRYIVAFRNLTTTDGESIAQSPAFAALVNRQTSLDPVLSQRQEHFNDIFDRITTAGIDPTELTLAWDFVTASSEALHNDMLHIRDEGLELIGEDGPELTITSIERFTVEQDENIAIRLLGTMEVPHYVVPEPINPVITGWALNYGDDGLPEPVGSREMKWWAMVPHSAINQPEVPHSLMQYGHGLLGEGDQVFSGFNRRIANTYNIIVFGCEMIGMADEDYTNVLVMVKEMSNFHWLSDRLHQGLFEHLALARTMRQRFESLPEIAAENVNVNEEELFYSGISQGGIFGATLMALTTDMRHGHLGVPGNHYNTLLFRSVDFTPFFEQMADAYPDSVDQALVLATIQLLWDKADPVSYLRHVTAEPFPGNTPHSILLAPAKGDWQVSVNTNEVAARSNIGIAIMQNYDVDRQVWGVEETPYPHTGSGVVLYDFGNPWPAENINLPPNDEIGDPHELPRRQPWHDEQLVHFLRTGEIIDTCGGDGCTPD